MAANRPSSSNASSQQQRPAKQQRTNRTEMTHTSAINSSISGILRENCVKPLGSMVPFVNYKKTNVFFEQPVNTTSGRNQPVSAHTSHDEHLSATTPTLMTEEGESNNPTPDSPPETISQAEKYPPGHMVTLQDPLYRRSKSSPTHTAQEHRHLHPSRTLSLPQHGSEESDFSSAHQEVREPPSQLQQAFIKSLKPFIRHAVHCNMSALGHGSFGSVHKFSMGRMIVAGKIYRVPPPSDIENYVQCFTSMFNILFKLQHKNIVSYLGVCPLPSEEFPILLMECCERSLQAFLEESLEMLSTKLRILRNIADGLNYLHKQNPAIIHRDLTASNVLLDKHQTAKIADFGLAKLITLGQPMTMTAIGTAHHLPPEASENTYDEKIDIFSFGHLAIFTTTQEAIKFLPRYIKRDESTGNSVSVSEVERRQEHISRVTSIVGQNHFINTLIRECLSDFPQDRPSASIILERFGEGVIDLDDLNDVCVYLQDLTLDQLRTLGLVLGLSYSTLENYGNVSKDAYMHQLLAAWLRQQDNVMITLPPTWNNLVKALMDARLRQRGIATRISHEKVQT